MSAQDLAVRRYLESDLPAVLDLNAYGLKAAGIDPGEDYYEGADFADVDMTYSEAAGGVLLVGEVAGRLVAMGGIRRIDERKCELLRMRVDPEHQGRGYGRAILDRLEREARRLGYRRVRLLTGQDQRPAVDLYARHGYQVIGRQTLVGIPSVHMEKDLGSPS